MNRDDFNRLRKEYLSRELLEKDAPDDPEAFFIKWLEEATRELGEDANAMTLATVSSKGRPSARIVLLKDIDDGKYIFYTNYESKKAENMAQNNAVALLFWWPQLERQVRIEGRVKKASEDLSNQYFAMRPIGSQIGAIASPQSKIISGRQELDLRVQSIVEQGTNISRPSYWGGYTMQPDYYEFWQGRASRLHDRIAYLKGDEGFEKVRLAP